jgi:hypothetical protein
MGRLVRIANDEICVGHRYVAGPGYKLNVADYNAASTPPQGWKYYEEEVTTENFYPLWKQPAGAHDTYALGTIVQHGTASWTSTIANNVWEPGVYGWKNTLDTIESWRQPLGAHDSYILGSVVKYNNKLWKSLIDSNVWTPGVSGWREEVITLPTGAPSIPAWVQPTGGHDAYQIDAVVTHNGKTWKSTVSNNVWAPGVYGWVEV